MHCLNQMKEIRKRAYDSGRYDSDDLTIKQLFELFPDEETAQRWFEALLWNGEPQCGHCHGSDVFKTKSGKPQKDRSRSCKRHFNDKTGTYLQGTRVPLTTRIHAIYLVVSNIEGISSICVYRELSVTQRTVWYMMHRIRQAMGVVDAEFDGEVEVDETFVGGKERNDDLSKKLNIGHGAVGNKAVVSVKQRGSKKVKANVVDETTRTTLHELIDENVEKGVSDLH